MDIDKFWRQAEDTFNLYHDRYRRTLLTEQEQRTDIRLFLSDMAKLAALREKEEDNK